MTITARRPATRRGSKSSSSIIRAGPSAVSVGSATSPARPSIGGFTALKRSTSRAGGQELRPQGSRPQSLVATHAGGLSPPKAPSDAGELRIWSLLGNSEISVRTVGRIMALNRQVYDDIPYRPTQDAPKDPRPHPYRATAPMSFGLLTGAKWTLPSRASNGGASSSGWLLTDHAGRGGGTHGSQLGGLDGALYGVFSSPKALISDSGGAFTSNEFEAVCTRLQIDHKPMESTKGKAI